MTRFVIAYLVGLSRALSLTSLGAKLDVLRSPRRTVGFGRMLPVCGGSDEDGNPDTATKEASERIQKLREELVDSIKNMNDPNPEDRDEVKRREDELGKAVDAILAAQRDADKSARDAEFAKLREELGEHAEKVKQLEMEPTGDPKTVGRRARSKDRPRYEGNIFADLAASAGNPEVSVEGGRGKARERFGEYESKAAGPDQQKLWATGDLEDVDLVLPDFQPALPFLRAMAKIAAMCRELRTTSPSVEFPVFTSGLTVEVVDDQVPETKPDSSPNFELRTARVFTIAGTSQVPNSTLEDYAFARGWISSELGLATGVEEDRLFLGGTGAGEPLGILEHSEITGRAATDANGDGKITGRDVIDATFRAMQDVRFQGFKEPSGIALNPAVWTDVVLSYEGGVGYLYGAPGSQAAPPQGEPAERLLGLPVVQDAYITTTYGATSKEAPIIVGDWSDAIVIRRSPFRVDVDTSLGFRQNTTWFRGEERAGFIVVRPKSFKVVTNVVPAA